MFKPIILGLSKSKSRSSTRPQTVVQSELYNNLDVLQQVYGGGIVDTRNKVETIDYTTTPHGRPLRFNMCRHGNAVKYYDGSAETIYRIPDNRPGHGGWYSLYTGSAIHSELAHSIALTAAASAFGNPTLGYDYVAENASDFINLTAERVKPDLTQLSLPNFLLELDDVRQLFSLWNRFKGLAANVAGAHLNYSFGWKPTIGDLKRMLKTVQSVRDRLDAFKRASGEIIYRSVELENVELSESGVSNYGINGDTVVWKATLSRRVSGHVKYKILPIKEMSAFEENLRLYLDAFGFELNAGIIWEAVPFSFVVDWFLDLGKLFDRLSVDTLELPIEYVDSCLQYSEDYKVESKLNLLAEADLDSLVPTKAWITDDAYFARFPVTPNRDILAGIGFRFPKLNQALLLGSLVTALASGR